MHFSNLIFHINITCVHMECFKYKWFFIEWYEIIATFNVQHLVPKIGIAVDTRLVLVYNSTNTRFVESKSKTLLWDIYWKLWRCCGPGTHFSCRTQPETRHVAGQFQFNGWIMLPLCRLGGLTTTHAWPRALPLPSKWDK